MSLDKLMTEIRGRLSAATPGSPEVVINKLSNLMNRVDSWWWG